jgi:RNA polymerase sigma-70 factor (ECF subfamily)
MDDDIAKLLQARQYPEAFSTLVERFKDRVFRLAFSILANETQAEDAAQDVFVRIWKGLPGYHGGASISTWIYAITRNTSLTLLKRRRTHTVLSLEDPEVEAAPDHLAAVEATPANPGADLDVESLLSGLPEKYRRVVVLFYLEQKAYDEVAAMLGMPLGTVKTLLFRARKELLRIGARAMRRPESCLAIGSGNVRSSMGTWGLLAPLLL